MLWDPDPAPSPVLTAICCSKSYIQEDSLLATESMQTTTSYGGKSKSSFALLSIWVLANYDLHWRIEVPIMSHQCNQSSRGDMQGFISFWRIDSIPSMQMDPSNRHIQSWKWRYWRAYMAATANSAIIPSCGGIPALLIGRSIHCSSFVSVPKVWQAARWR
jgi:hypothetical protein